MRTTVRVDDDLFDQLKAEARKEKISVTRLLNRALKAGLEARTPRRRQAPYRERAHSMGTPRVALDKALALAAAMEDEEHVRELHARR